MAFKENLLKKIALDQMKSRVLSTIGPSGSGNKVDRKAMKGLLEAAGFTYMSLRGLEMYSPESSGGEGKRLILVLDNDLTIYNSTVNDVVMRKEPTLKEMISIRNAMRILNDGDVVVSRKEKSVETVYNDGLSRMDLTFTPDDIKKLEYDGRAAVEWNDSAAVLESLSLFSELLDLSPEPKAFRLENVHIRGRLEKKGTAGELFGPAVAYAIGDGSIRWIGDTVALSDKDGVRTFLDKVQGKKDPDLMGPSVIVHLAAEVMREKGWTTGGM